MVFFFTFLKLYQWYQIAQRTAMLDLMNNLTVLLSKLVDQHKLNIGFIFRISYFTNVVIQFLVEIKELCNCIVIFNLLYKNLLSVSNTTTGRSL